MKIGNHDLTKNVYIIAEIGGNHDGKPDVAELMVERAIEAGVDAVKFQTYKAETLVHPSLRATTGPYASQLERLKNLELSDRTYERIIDRCNIVGIDFLTTPFDLDILAKFAPVMPAIKIASGDITYHKLIKAAAAYGKPVILSTGAATVNEILDAEALVPYKQCLLLHCVSLYPTPDGEANLGNFFLGCEYHGYSDHTVGPLACYAAVALGARIIEKHFTLDAGRTDGDHPHSLEPHQMKIMVQDIRRIEKMLGATKPAAGETDAVRARMRRGLYPDGSVVRPFNGVEPDA